MKPSVFSRLAIALLVFLVAGSALPYPIDGYEQTGIRRLERQRLILAGEMNGNALPPGARKNWADITLHLTDAPTLDLPASDEDLERRVARLFGGRRDYSIAVLDITPGAPLRLARYNWENRYQPGSVAKLAVAVGLFSELQRIYPDDTEARRQLLKSRMVTGGFWVRPNSHSVPIFNLETRHFQSRSVLETDVFSLYEWADHMVSASSNAAATVVWKEALLMRAFGADYPPTSEQEAAFFKETPKRELTAMAMSVVNDPLRAEGVAQDDFQLGSMFTAAGTNVIPSGGSHANPRGLLTFLFRLEQGRLVDEWSSLEIKRLMYSTERRIRYAASPALSTSALYFKSGSLYKCQQEEGFECGRYMGNVHNFMNSVAIVETPDDRVYMVALMTNVLRKNSASDHLALANNIEEIMKQPR